MNVADSCAPIAPPIVRITVFIPVAAPVWCAGTAVMIRLPRAAYASPMPIPISPAVSSMSYGWACANVVSPNPAAATAEPPITAALEPNLRAIGPAKKLRLIVPAVNGSRYTPDITGEAPNPNPVLRGSWAYCGKTMNVAYMPAPSRNAARLVVATRRIRIIAMSINGSRLRFSTTIHSAQTARPAASRPIVRADPQPQPVVSVTAISVRVIPILISSAAGQLTLPLVRTGDSGTNSQVASADSAIGTSGIQNSHCQASFSTISAPAMMPTA